MYLGVKEYLALKEISSMYKTKEQLYEELKELTEESRKRFKRILNDIVKSEALLAHSTKVPMAFNLIDDFDISELEFRDMFENFVSFQYNDLYTFCDYWDMVVLLKSGRNSNKVYFLPKADDTILEDLFAYRAYNYQDQLKEFIEDYFDHDDSFSEYMCDNSITSTDIYSEDFYELATVKELQIILAEYKEVFQEEIDKLKKLQNNLYACVGKLEDIINEFPENFEKYLEDMGYERFGE